MNLRHVITGKAPMKKVAYPTTVKHDDATDDDHYHNLMVGLKKILQEVDEVKHEVDQVKQEQNNHKEEINSLKVDRIGKNLVSHSSPQVSYDAPKIDYQPVEVKPYQEPQLEKPRTIEGWLDDVIPMLHSETIPKQPANAQIPNLEQKLSTFGYKGKTPAEVSENWWSDEKAKILGTHESTSIYDEDLNYSAIMDANVLQLVLTARDAITKGDLDVAEKTIRRLYDTLRLYVSFDMNAEEERKKWVRYREDKIRELEEKVEQQDDVIYGRGGLPTEEEEPAQIAKKEVKKPIAALDGRLGGGFKERPLRERKTVSESDLRPLAQEAIDEFKRKVAKTPPECHYIGDGRWFRGHVNGFVKRNQIAGYVLTDVKTTLSNGTEISAEDYLRSAWDETFADARIKFKTPDAKKFRKLWEADKKGKPQKIGETDLSSDEDEPDEAEEQDNRTDEDSQNAEEQHI